MMFLLAAAAMTPLAVVAGRDRLVGGSGVDTLIFANGGGLDLVGGFRHGH